ncbi:MAG: hypothetical protein ACE5JC_06745 [Candidatus Zixiibacteriota bacterium]
MATVGYLEGTDSTILTRLAISGIDTLPLSNGVDGHGKYVNHLSKGEVDVVVGYAHKLTPAAGIPTSPKDMLFACRIQDIPVLIVAPRDTHEATKKILGEATYKGIVAPEDLFDEIKKTVG